MKKILLVIFCSLFLWCQASPLWAEVENVKGPTDEEIVVDLLVVRPLSLAAMIISTGAFVFTLPFTWPTKSVGLAKKRLVERPYQFTFKRPIGEFPAY